MQDADKEEPQEYGIERYFYTPIPEGNSCLLRQVRGYELEVLPKTLPVREITLALRWILFHNTNASHCTLTSLLHTREKSGTHSPGMFGVRVNIWMWLWLLASFPGSPAALYILSMCDICQG